MVCRFASSLALAFVALAQEVPLEGYEYSISVPDGRELHANDDDDMLLSTRFQSHDGFARFIFERIADGSDSSEGVFRIRVKADKKMLHADDESTFRVSTQYQGDDDYNHFLVSSATKGTTIRTVASNRAWVHDPEIGKDDELITTTSEDGTLFSLTKLGPITSCSAKSDCAYNGECVSGVCNCYAAWKGEHCGVMNFVPTTSSPRTALKTIDQDGLQVSSWGGSVLQHDDGSWHMWAAEMVDGTGIKSWISNSQVVHAVADGPLGPWTRKEVVHPVFAHEPTVARAPTGEYVMYFSGAGPAYGDDEIPCTGKSCFGYNGTSDRSCPNDQQCSVDIGLLSRMSYATSPNGPWSEPQIVPGFGGGDTNLAHVIYEDGSMFGLGRPGHYWASPDWKDLSKYTIGTTKGDLRGEDPMVWIDEIEGPSVLHAVLHGGGWSDPYGFHYVSVDNGTTWRGDNSVKTYQNIIEFSDGQPALNLSRRERPHVILGGKSGKTPIAMSAGVTEAWPCALIDPPTKESNWTGILCPVDYCYTLVQGLATETELLV